MWHAGKYVDAESDPDEVVADLEGLLQHISGLGEALALYNQYLALFDAAPDDLASLAQAEKEANSRYQVRHTLRPLAPVLVQPCLSADDTVPDLHSVRRWILWGPACEAFLSSAYVVFA